MKSADQIVVGLNEKQIKELTLELSKPFGYTGLSIKDRISKFLSSQKFTSSNKIGLNAEQIRVIWKTSFNFLSFDEFNERMNAGQNSKDFKEMSTFSCNLNKPLWKNAPSWAEWLAKDADGTWMWYEFKPEKLQHSWSATGESESANFIYSDWEESLEKRPLEYTKKVEIGDKYVYTGIVDLVVTVTMVNYETRKISFASKEGFTWEGDLTLALQKFNQLNSLGLKLLADK